jgi:hypothetical protein
LQEICVVRGLGEKTVRFDNRGVDQVTSLEVAED